MSGVYLTGSLPVPQAILNRHPTPLAIPRRVSTASTTGSMNINKATLAVLVLLIIGALLYEHNQTREVQATLNSIAKDRDTLNRQIGNLARLVAETKTHEVSTPE